MYVQEVIIDGFKSYSTRTVISGWDPEFNAITGLNGSGKSNILDAICFVLGLTNLSQVRAQNLQDLVYKRGQAGITKASVTIVFNNTDKRQSPLGFEGCDQITVTRQVVIGGKNKFLINGHVAQNQAVANLFQSVQLNINNPHFLIMQGRITKVLNMKPPEILALIEEAAGTRMFEEKKEKALKTIQKKDQKLLEITDLMENDIAPKLDRLKKEKADFMAYQKIEGELERLKRFVVAHDYAMTSVKVDKGEREYAEKQERMGDLKKRIKEISQEVEELTHLYQNLMKRKEKELKKSSKFADLQQRVNDLANQLTRANAQYDLKVKTVEEEEQLQKQYIQQQVKLEKSIQEGQRSQATVGATVEAEKLSLKKSLDDLSKKEAFLQTLTTGISANEGQDNGFIDQIQKKKDEFASVSTEIEQANMRVKFLSEQMEQKQSSLDEVKAETDNYNKKRNLLKREALKFEEKLKDCNYDQSLDLELKQRENQERREIEIIEGKIDGLSGQLSNLDFTFTDPSKGFDRSKVKGFVAKLLRISRENLKFAQALQTCAEGRLYFVVVEDNQVASALLKDGKLKRKYTIIPLKQIQAPQISREKIERAKALAPGKVEFALDLIKYDSKVSKAMEFVFGNTFICLGIINVCASFLLNKCVDSDAAKKVAYNPTIKMRCITVDGDIYDPGATITGGSSGKGNGSNLLVKLHELQALEETLGELGNRYAETCRLLSECEEKRKKYAELEHQLNVKMVELSSVEKIISLSKSGMLIAEIERIELELGELQEKIREKQGQKKSLDMEVKNLEKEMREFDSGKEVKLKKLESEIAKGKKELQKMQTLFQKRNQEYLEGNENVEELNKEFKELKMTIETSKESLLSMQKEISQLTEEISALKIDYDDSSKELDRLCAAFAQFDQDLNKAESEKKQKQNDLNEASLTVQRLGHELESMKSEIKSNEQILKTLTREHDWLDDQKGNFGKPNTLFDFTAQNPIECRKRLSQLKQEHESLRKKINVKVMNMIDRVVTKEKSLKQMLATVQRDKKKIEETIEQLDAYKKEAMQKTWTKVNRYYLKILVVVDQSDFGSIFDELLPGNTCKLEPPEGQTMADGLEVKVCLGGVWKQSLNELSGGQRSLVALSLILSLLQFKPAPMYILDEIDAALDLSHTQNIGQLFRHRFKGSQFIVVSLKEGMFNNANVLFKAKFKDGTSVVDRFVQKPSGSGLLLEKTAAKATKRVRKNMVDNVEAY